MIPLIVAAKHNPRVKKVIAINPYDYARGMGIARGNGWAWLTFNLAKVPVLGETVMRLRNRFIEQRILQGGVANPEAITPGLVSRFVLRVSGQVTIAPSSTCSAMRICGMMLDSATARLTYQFL